MLIYILPKRNENISHSFDAKEQRENDPVHHPLDVLANILGLDTFVGPVGRIERAHGQDDKAGNQGRHHFLIMCTA